MSLQGLADAEGIDVDDEDDDDGLGGEDTEGDSPSKKGFNGRGQNGAVRRDYHNWRQQQISTKVRYCI